MTNDVFYQIVNYIAKCIKGSEFEGITYAVGGCVRDLKMRNEIKDIDLVIEMENGGIKLAEYMHRKKLLTRPPIIYPTYGTAMFKFKKFNQDEIECVQTRGEQYHDKDSRNPVVTYASLKEDCFRRDLTINALYYNISTGEIMDPTGMGVNDINNKVARVTNENPDIVYTDDPLRILRTVRFSVKYNLDIEENTLESMKRNAGRLNIITQERITDEFNKMMLSPDPARALDLMRYVGVMVHVIPEYTQLFDVEQNEYHFGSAGEHTNKVVDNARTCQIMVPEKWKLAFRLSCVFHDIGKLQTRTVGSDDRVHFYCHENRGAVMTGEIMRRMRYSNDIIKNVCFLVENHMRTKQFKNDLSGVKEYAFNKLAYECNDEDRLLALLALIDCDNMAHKQEYCMPDQAKLIYEHIMNGDARMMFGYKLPITGEDVMSEMNIGPCEDVKHYLRHCLNKAFKNPRITKEECLYCIKHETVRKEFTGKEFKKEIDRIRKK